MTIDPHCRQVEVLLARRTVLRAIGTGVALGLLPTGCSGVPPTLAPPPGQTLVVLTPRTYAVLTAASARLVGPRGAPLVLDRTIDVGTLADAWLARTPALAGPVGQALLLLELGVWPLIDKLWPFTALDGRSQDAVLEDCMTSRLELKRSVFRGIRALAMLTFYGSPASRALTGFPGPFGGGDVTIADAMRD
jgi:hypothetical protein